MAAKPVISSEDVHHRVANTIEALAIEAGVSFEVIRDMAAGFFEGEAIESTADARTVNNTARQQYRVLSDMEKTQIDSVKELGAMMIGLCHEIGGTDPDGDRAGSRNLALAITHFEDGVMRAVRHITA